jgi:lipoprotein-anchoring transpeptidase ErfK/SrfK
MGRTALAVVGFVAGLGLAHAAPGTKVPTIDEVNGAPASEPPKQGIGAATLKAQVLLDRLRFSPGVIDGLNGENFRSARAAFEKSHALKTGGKLTGELMARLTEASPEPALVEYTISDDDVKGPFVEIPEKFEDKAGLERLGFSSAAELLSEKFHMDPDLLTALNPGRTFDKAGTTIVVANVHVGGGNGSKPVKATKLEVDKKARQLRAVSEDGAVLAVYPASVGSKEKPAPRGTHNVRALAPNPTYTYNPEYKFKSVKAKEKFEIKAGPNNPVGSMWIDLSVASFGIHGTPEPALVGKVASHGCVRLTNWDVEELSRMVQKGTPVTFLD